MNLFVFGTLRDRRTLKRVIRREPTSEHKRAILPGYLKFQCDGLDFVLRYPGERVRGVLWTDIDERDIWFLDNFESTDMGWYKRVDVKVACDGTMVDAQAYVCGHKWFEETK